MKVVINQYFGIGDVIFCQTLANDLIKQGHEVIWPVMVYFVEDLQRAYPNIKFVDYKTFPIDYDRRDEHDSGQYRVIPLRWNVEILGVHYNDCMKSKYSLFEQDWTRWRESAMWVRNQERENTLYNIVTRGAENYNFVNKTFASNFKGKVSIKLDNGLPIVEMSQLFGFSLFDWAKVLENAAEIHTVSTSIIYLLEMLDLKAKEIHLYDRKVKGQGLANIDYILQKHQYILHG